MIDIGKLFRNFKRLLSSEVYISRTIIYNGKEVPPDSELGKRMRKVSGKMHEASKENA